MPIPTIETRIDWDNDGSFEGGVEDVTAFDQHIRILMGRTGLLGMAPPSACELQLKNNDARFSPENTGSPISPNVLPRRQMRIRVTSPITRTIFQGRVDDIEVEPIAGASISIARITGLDDTAYLLREQGNIYTAQTGLIPLEPDSSGVGPLTGIAAIEVLDQVGWPGGGSRAIDAGITEMDTFWGRDIDGLALMEALVREEQGYAYADAGVFTFEDRGHRYKGAHLTSQATYSDASGAALRYQHLRPYRMGVENVYNFARAQTRPRTASAAEQVWTLGIPEDSSGAANPVALAPGESRSFFPTWDNPASGTYAVTFVANSAADGTGTDLTASVTKTETEPKANRYKVKLGNNAAQTVYITSMFLTVNIRLPQDEATEGEAQDTTSQTAYGVRRYPISPQWMGKQNNGDDWAAYAVAAFKNPVPLVVLTFKPYDATMLTEMLTRKVSDRVTIVNNEIGLSADFFVEGTEHVLDRNEDWTTTMWLSKVQTGNQFMLLDDDPLAKLGDAGIGAVFG